MSQDLPLKDDHQLHGESAADNNKISITDTNDDNDDWESCSDDDNSDKETSATLSSPCSSTAASSRGSSDLVRHPVANKKNKRINDTVSRLFNSISSTRRPVPSSPSAATKKGVRRMENVTLIKAENDEPINVDDDDPLGNVSVPVPKKPTTTTTLSYEALVMEATTGALNDSFEDRVVPSLTMPDQPELPAPTTATTTLNAIEGLNENELSNLGLKLIDARCKTINRIDNIGYSQWNNIAEYCCLIANCGYETGVLHKLLTHIEKYTNVSWGGYCFICDRQVFDTDMPLVLEFQHMAETHLSSKTVATGNGANSSGAENQRPIIKFRRLSGDKLSCATAAAAAANATTTTTTTAADSELKLLPLPFKIISVSSIPTQSKKSTESDAPKLIKITNVVGGAVRTTTPTMTPPTQLSSGDAVALPQLLDSNVNVLKPWTKSESQKSAAVNSFMLRDVSLYSLYKCMAVDCQFTTNLSDRMLTHLRSHDFQMETAVGGLFSDTSSWLECAYCEVIADSCTLLVKHIQDEHATSIFQCPYCFYRSCAAYNVVIHTKQLHKAQRHFVLVCNGKTKMLASELSVIHQARDVNVRAISCGKGWCAARRRRREL